MDSKNLEGKIPIKIISTCLREIDVSDFTPIVEHPTFLNLADRTQLSFVDKKYLGARHSRLEHSCFVFHFTDELTRKLYEKCFLTKKQVTDIKIGSLLHDLGHPPFSHSTEFVLGYTINHEKPKTHHDRNLELLNGDKRDLHGRTLKETISICGGNFENILNIVSKSSPEVSIISHNTIGTDKLAFLLIDQYHTGYHPQIPFLLDLFPYYIYKNEELGIAKQKIPPIMSIQRLIQDMYSDVYWNEEVNQYIRMIQKSIELEINSDYLTPQEAWEMNEGALLYRLKNSKNKIVRRLIERYYKNELFQPSITFKIEDFITKEKNEEIVIPIKRDIANKLLERYKDPTKLTELERKICESIDIPFAELMVKLTADPKRMIPEDTIIYSNNQEKIGTLFQIYPKHYSSLLERAEAFFAFRFYVGKSYSNHLKSQVKYVKNEIEEELKG